ncbi:MAG: polysaccharide lyase 6 family protein [Chitinophagaceae bacterium]
MKRLLFFSFCSLLLPAVYATTWKVRTPEELDQRISSLQPGDTVQLANGTWNNVALITNKKGTAAAPIVFIAETPGRVLLTGNSYIRIGGEYIEINGLSFVNGYTTNGAIIEYRDDKKNLANNCRITNCVIDGYNKPDRLADDNWIILYGKQNRFDHNHVANKKNLGTILVVELNNVLNQDNNHRIDHNYFGTRDRLGSNGGEIMRIGNSTFSRTSSKTIIEENFFYHCNGEVEIVSVKSCDNIVRRNTFYECEGSLVLRHGNRNLVESNFFIGNNREYTGGVRVINAGHIVKDNFFYGLAGDRFRAAFAIMNGVPNSPINRYDPVKDVTITSNTFVDCAAAEWCAGKDFERTARPQNVVFANNAFYSTGGNTAMIVNDSVSGIRFTGNQANFIVKGLPATGFKKTTTQVVAENGGWKIQGGQVFIPVATENNTGVNWYNKHTAAIAENNGRVIMVSPGQNTLSDKIADLRDGDILELQAGVYPLSTTLMINKKISIRAAAGSKEKPVIQFSGEKGGFAFFSIENGGSMRMNGVVCNGASENGMADCFIRTSLKPMIEHYSVWVSDCDFINLTDGRKQAFKANKASFADTVQFKNCRFSDITGEVISIAAEKEDKGIYNAEVVLLQNCIFNKVLVGAVDIYRGGNDESTTGPYFRMDHCTFNEVGNVELCSVVKLLGVQVSGITNCIFYNSGRSGRTVLYEDYGWTKNKIDYINSYVAGKVQSYYNNIVGKNMWRIDPQLEQTEFRLKPSSPLKKKGNDGKDLGALWENGRLSY